MYMSTILIKTQKSHHTLIRVCIISTLISVCIPKYQYSYNCTITLFSMIVSIPKYKYKYNCKYSLV